jgi:hypothetical protein
VGGCALYKRQQWGHGTVLGGRSDFRPLSVAAFVLRLRLAYSTSMKEYRSPNVKNISNSHVDVAATMGSLNVSVSR